MGRNLTLSSSIREHVPVKIPWLSIVRTRQPTSFRMDGPTGRTQLESAPRLRGRNLDSFFFLFFCVYHAILSRPSLTTTSNALFFFLDASWMPFSNEDRHLDVHLRAVLSSSDPTRDRTAGKRSRRTAWKTNRTFGSCPKGEVHRHTDPFGPFRPPA